MRCVGHGFDFFNSKTVFVDDFCSSTATFSPLIGKLITKLSGKLTAIIFPLACELFPASVCFPTSSPIVHERRRSHHSQAKIFFAAIYKSSIGNHKRIFTCLRINYRVLNNLFVESRDRLFFLHSRFVFPQSDRLWTVGLRRNCVFVCKQPIPSEFFGSQRGFFKNKYNFGPRCSINNGARREKAKESGKRSEKKNNKRTQDESKLFEMQFHM